MFLGVIPYSVVRRNRGDVLEVTSDFLNISKMNPEGSRFHLRRNSPLEITLEHVEGSGSEASIEAASTLNLWDTECGFRRRTILGLWLSEEAKSDVLKDLERFLIKHGFIVTVLNKTDKIPTKPGVDDNLR